MQQLYFLTGDGEVSAWTWSYFIFLYMSRQQWRSLPQVHDLPTTSSTYKYKYEETPSVL